MIYRTLGRTGIRVSALAFGAGPVSGLMTGADADTQFATVRRAVEVGINWFDTAAGYGQGQSEANLGAGLRQLGVGESVHVATKVRLAADQLDDIPGTVRRGVRESLERLGLPRVTLIQLHNSITARRGDEPTSITPDDVLGPGGVLAVFRELQANGLADHLGLTGIGQPEALRTVLRSGAFQAIQIPYHLLNPSAGQQMEAGFAETDYGNLIADCAANGVGVLAIRVFAAGALIGQPPSAHTKKTPFFPLALYERDLRRAERLAAELGGADMKEVALRFVLSHPDVAAAIVGFGAPGQIDEAVRYAEAGPLPEGQLSRLRGMDHNTGAMGGGRAKNLTPPAPLP